MQNFPKTEEEFEGAAQEEFMDNLREIVTKIHEYVECSCLDIDTNDIRIVLALPTSLVPPLKKLIPEESMMLIGDLFLGFYVDNEYILVLSNVDEPEPHFYVTVAPEEVPRYKHNEGRTVDVEFTC